MNLLLKGYDYNVWSEESTDKEKSTDQGESTDIPPMTSLESDEAEVKEGKGLKVLTQNKFLIQLQILLAQIKVENNSNKLKNEIR